MFKSRKSIYIFLICAFSVLVRIPNINRPLSKHHEFLTAISLRVLQIWDQGSPNDYHFAPVMSYSGKANKNINNNASTTGKMKDGKGNFYYVSHPPFAYILPHTVFSVFKIKPTVLSLELFLLICSLITAWFVLLIARDLAVNMDQGKRDSIEIISLLIYLTSSSVLWFQTNTYMSDILVHCFFVFTVWCVLKNKYWLTAIAIFLTIYTSWLGVFLAFSVFVYSIFKKEIKFLLPITLGTIGSLILIFFQYSSIAGSAVFLEQLTQRFSERGNTVNSEENSVIQKFREVILLIMNYLILYFPMIILLIFHWFKSQKKGLDILKNKFVFISLFPIALLHLFLLNYSGHNFTALYASLPFSIACAYILVQVFQKRMALLTILIVSFSIGSYYFINRPGEYSWKGDVYAVHKVLGEKIKKEARSSQTIFLVTDYMNPMVIVYAERNMIKVESMEEVISAKDSLKLTDYIVFEEK